MKQNVIYAALFVLAVQTGRLPAAEPPATLTVGVVNYALERTLAQNRDKIVTLIGQAATSGCRLVVFPEGALWAYDGTRPKAADIEATKAVIARAADAHNVYALVCTRYNYTSPFNNRMCVWNPDGQLIYNGPRLWAHPAEGAMPPPFEIDGIKCCGYICADRWLRGMQELPVMMGAQISIDCSNNYQDEWDADRPWNWSIAGALRNNVFVVFCNTANNAGVIYHPDTGDMNKHGHSAVIAPDGRVQAFSSTLQPDPLKDKVVITTINLKEATRAEAMARRNHPLFKSYWDTGLACMAHQEPPWPDNVPSFGRVYSYPSPPTIKYAVGQMACSRCVADNVAKMKAMIRTAKTNGAKVVVFPELCVTGALETDILAASQSLLDTALTSLTAQADASDIYVIFGMPYRIRGDLYNCAFVVGPQGTVQTRHAAVAVDRPQIFKQGSATSTMWFHLQVGGVKVWSLVSVGSKELLWSEIAELAACRGAQPMFHIGYDTDATPAGALRRRQLGCVWSSVLHSFVATVNAASPASLALPSAPANGGSIVWEDFRRGALGGNPTYRPYGALVKAEAGTTETILYATETLRPSNGQFARMTGSRYNPQMKDWYEMGVHCLEFDGSLAGMPVMTPEPAVTTGTQSHGAP
ncbi:carbon-nitrogen hydrolase family protein [Candidatus Sumerlaeota bacterium]|nr:carbon-nitrogen hydrolase family protein [Candidatus Sumerlaeota bacterium]